VTSAWPGRLLFTLGLIGGASITAGWATARPGVEIERVRPSSTRTRADDQRAGDRRRAGQGEALINGRARALQRVEERADRLSMYATLLDDPDLINRMLDRYLAVTAEDIRTVCEAVLRPDNRTVLTYLPIEAGAEAAEDVA
jgi:predicted Zn-dependent peptidase